MSERSKRKGGLARENARLRKQIAGLEQNRRDLYRAEEALAQYWNLLDAILSSTEDLYGLKGTDFSYQAANQAFCRFTGVTEAGIRGKTDFDLFPKPLAEVFHHGDAHVIQRAQPILWEAQLPVRQRPIWARIQKTPVFNNNGESIGILCIVRDQTTLNRYQRQQEILTATDTDGFWCADARGLLLEVSQNYCGHTGYERGELVGKRIQELSVLSAPQELARHYRTVVKRGYGNFRSTHRAKDGRRLSFEMSVVYTTEHKGRFFHYFRNPTEIAPEQPSIVVPEPIATEIRTDRRVLNLNDVVVLAINQEIDKIPPGISIRKDLEPKLKNTLANHSQILQIALNLLTNAVESMDGQGHIRVITRNVELSREWLGNDPNYTPGPYVFLAIKDSGRGIGPALREKIFEPFITTKFKGRGMGLASVTRNVGEHKGIVTVKSQEGRGSTFYVYLPATEAKIEPRLTSPQIPSGTETILFIDRETRVLEEGRLILERLAYRVLLANDLNEGMRLVKGHFPPVDAVVLDVSASQQTYDDFIRHLIQAQPGIKVLLTGVHGLNETCQDLMDAGAHGFIPKPFRAESLAPKIRLTLDS